MKLEVKINTYLILVIVFGCNMAGAQTTFELHDDNTLTQGYRGGIPTAIADVNGDGRDDLVRVTNRNILEVNLSSSNSEELYKVTYEAALPDFPWNISIGNIDNEGCNEIVLGTIYRGGYIFSFDNNLLELNLKQVTDQNFYSQGANLVDMNGDGYLDWFVNDDEAISDIFLNDQTGNFIEADTFIDLRTRIDSDNSGNYSSEWIDFDSDGDIDCYVSKCRVGVESDTDPRRVNQLFVNDGQNNYTENAARYGLDIGAQTWASNFGDIDNDGDLDAIVINHFDRWSLLENIENDTFIDRNASIDSVTGFANQCLLRDFDNNGYLDVLVTGPEDYLWYNQGDWTFIRENVPFLYFKGKNFSVGDINHDGFLDIYACYSSSFNDPGQVDDGLHINHTNDNNWIGFTLRGTASNANGIGATIKVFTPELGWQTRSIRSGESYGIMNSLNATFGLSNSTGVDSLIFSWPSGQIDKYSGVEGGQYFTVTEGICLESPHTIEIENAGIICPDSPIRLAAKEDLSYEWSNGEQFSTTIVDNPGVYMLSAVDGAGCNIPYSAMLVEDYDSTKYATIIELDKELACYSESIKLSSPPASSYRWSTGETTNEIFVTASDSIDLELIDYCNNEHFGSAVVNIINPVPIVTNDTVPDGNAGTLVADGANLSWYENLDDVDAFLQGDSLTIDSVTTPITFYAEGATDTVFSAQVIGESEWSGFNRFSSKVLNGGMFFHVRYPVVIESMKLEADTTANRMIQVFDQERNLLFENIYLIDSGETTINLDLALEPGINYFITTSIDYNLQVFGYSGPQLVRSNADTNYPYRESDILWITNSSFGPEYYLYFYDWQIRRQDLTCVSERVAATIYTDRSISTVEIPEDQVFALYPNPTSAEFYVESNSNDIIDQVVVFNLTGDKILNKSDINQIKYEFSLGDSPAGIYMVYVLTSSDNFSSQRLIKMD